MNAGSDGVPGFQPALLAELEAARARRTVLTYRQLIARLQLPVPAMRPLTAALESLVADDARRGWPLRAALVVSQAGSRLPRSGFFECAERAGACPGGLSDQAQAHWHAAELERVFAFAYPGQAVARGTVSSGPGI